jgi:hypothetical protein
VSLSFLDPKHLRVVVKVDRMRPYETTLGDFIASGQFSETAREAMIREVAEGQTYFGMVGLRSRRTWTVRRASLPATQAQSVRPSALATRRPVHAEASHETLIDGEYTPEHTFERDDFGREPGPDFDDIIAADAFEPRLFDGVRVR